MTTLYDSLESVLIYLHDYSSNNDANIPNLFGKLWDFKFMYILYFLANILHMLSKLSRIFQSKLVDISTIGSIVKIEIVSIRMYFLLDSCNLNKDTFNPSIGFHIFPEFGPPGSYLCHLLSEIRGA